ncbi:hypothetical protein [Sphingomonas ginsengisoli (ex An et al. 2013)]|uniref:hypothetical protein n=1 Tax=Sphingomonas ginsengisoli (ex An et al. 2013) TaxID=363835 RepID=UPI00126A1B1B|nr:hypothetical protein [Sphingomonas ginsengisoli An et al. 2013]
MTTLRSTSSRPSRMATVSRLSGPTRTKAVDRIRRPAAALPGAGGRSAAAVTAGTHVPTAANPLRIQRFMMHSKG